MNRSVKAGIALAGVAVLGGIVASVASQAAAPVAPVCVFAQAKAPYVSDTVCLTLALRDTTTPVPPPPAPLPPPAPVPTPVPAPTSGPVTLPTLAARVIGPLTLPAATPAALARYETDFAKYEPIRWAADSAGGGAAGAGCAARGFDNTNYYDRAFALYQQWARTGNPVYRDHADRVAVCYRDGYVKPAGFNLQQHQWQFEGLVVHYALTGDTLSRNAVLSVVRRDYILAPASALTTETYAYWEGRIQARTLTGVLLAIELGDTSRPWGAIADSLVDRIAALQHPDGSFSWPAWVNSAQGTQANYMVGMLNNALALYYRLRKPDPRILPVVKRSLDYLWSTQWCGQGFNYTNKAPCANANGASDLTGLLVFGWGFYARAANDPSYQAIGDQIFAASITGAYLAGQKQFNQQYRETALYLGQRR